MAAPVLVVAASWRAIAWLRDCRRRAWTACEVLRVASEVLRQASILQGELAGLGPHPRAALYRVQCEALRARAELALEHPARVRQLSRGRLLRALSRLHNDLRKLKACRDELLVTASLLNCESRLQALRAAGMFEPAG